MGRLLNAARESNYVVASQRLRDLEEEIQQNAERAFEFEPKTSLGVAAQAAAVLALSFDAQSHKLAQKLAVSAIRVASSENNRKRRARELPGT
jgi:hypothetical protein